MQYLFNGNLFPDGTVTNKFTVCESIDNTHYKAKLIDPKEVKFEIRWKSSSIRGYQKFMEVPEDKKFDLSTSEKFKGMRIPENGAIYFIR